MTAAESVKRDSMAIGIRNDFPEPNKFFPKNGIVATSVIYTVAAAALIKGFFVT